MAVAWRRVVQLLLEAGKWQLRSSISVDALYYSDTSLKVLLKFNWELFLLYLLVIHSGAEHRDKINCICFTPKQAKFRVTDEAPNFGPLLGQGNRTPSGAVTQACEAMVG